MDMTPKQLHQLARERATSNPEGAAAQLQWSMLDLATGLTPSYSTDPLRMNAMGRTSNVRGALLRANLGTGTLAFGDFGRTVDSLKRAYLVEDGTDFQGAPVHFLTRVGLALATELQRFALSVEQGQAWKDHIPHAAPTAREHEQRALWGDKAMRGMVSTPNGTQRAWSNGYLAMLLDDTPNDQLPANQVEDPRTPIPEVNMARQWPLLRDITKMKPCEPVAVHGVLNADARQLKDYRVVWFSSGHSADARYIDAIQRMHPEIRFGYNEDQARNGVLHLMLPQPGGADRVVGVLATSNHCRAGHTMPPGVYTHWAMHWRTKGVAPNTRAMHMAMEDKLRELRSGALAQLPQQPGDSLVLRGDWVNVPHEHLRLHWDCVSNLALFEAARSQHVLVLGPAKMAAGEGVGQLTPDDLVRRWRQEAYRVNVGIGHVDLRVDEPTGTTHHFRNLDDFEAFRRERGLPGWFANVDLQELAAHHEEQGSWMWSEPHRRNAPPVTVGQRARWVGNAPAPQVVEGTVLNVERAANGAWRIVIRNGDMPTEVWSHRGQVEEAGWKLRRHYDDTTYLMEPSGVSWRINSTQELQDCIAGIQQRDPAIHVYATELTTTWWKTRDYHEYQMELDDIMERDYGIRATLLIDSNRIELERDLGNDPQTFAMTLADLRNLAPIERLERDTAALQAAAPGAWKRMHPEGDTPTNAAQLQAPTGDNGVDRDA